MTLKRGERVTLVPGEHAEGDAIPVNYPGLIEDIEEGNPILLADGTVQLTVVEKRDKKRGLRGRGRGSDLFPQGGESAFEPVECARIH